MITFWHLIFRLHDFSHFMGMVVHGWKGREGAEVSLRHYIKENTSQNYHF